MKKLFICVVLTVSFWSCNSNKNQANSSEIAGYKSFGSKISDEKTIAANDMASKYSTLKLGDTINVKFKSTIKEVCQNKGCWMKLDLGNKKETFVKFKDYAFFMPKDSKNNEVIVNGKAFVSEESVEDQKHYAKDGGMAQAEIDKIVNIKTIYSFVADGVLIKK
ncbi:DUF4920 domain-containing protein [Flavobacterium sp.]|uniref:DUF4920 domain-containing protein n=1 Tax=Flavobacterium sp. TaxID=239 RepID=UPI00286D8D28|nr:DUF4920 domain-containing protein [Flavobacterium sp.]